MIEKILWTEVGIGQPVSLAEGIVANGGSAVIVAPAALHTQWRHELERAGLQQPGAITLMSPQALYKKGFPESDTLIVIDDQFPEMWEHIADQVRSLWAQDRPVWVRINHDNVEYLLPKKVGDSAEEIAKTVETVLRAHGIEADRSWDEIAFEIFDEHPHLSTWLYAVGHQWDAAMGMNSAAERLLQAVNSSEKRQIVFYKRLDDVANIPGEHLRGGLAEVNSLVDRFESGEIKTLLVPCGKVTGWRTSLGADEVIVRFAGEGWERTEIAQGRTRARPLFLRDQEHDSRDASGVYHP